MMMIMIAADDGKIARLRSNNDNNIIIIVLSFLLIISFLPTSCKALSSTSTYYLDSLSPPPSLLSSTQNVDYITDNNNNINEKKDNEITLILPTIAKEPKEEEYYYSLRLAYQMHEEECKNGFRNFGRFSNGNKIYPNWSDDAFVIHSVGKQYSGPDEAAFPRNSDKVYQSKRPLVSQHECQNLIDEARDYITEGLIHQEQKQSKNNNQNNPTNSELGEAKVSTLPLAKEWLKHKMQNVFFPLLQNRFGLQAENLTLYDALIIGYGYFGNGCRSQPIHRDASLISLNIALSPLSNYTGGGTYFEVLDKKLHQDRGHITFHAGGTLHAGTGIQSGERWILVLFIIDKSIPQLARRCHTLGLNAQRRGDEKGNNNNNNNIEESKMHFETSLTINPWNHLVYKDLGRSYSMEEDNIMKSRKQLAITCELYPFDTQAILGLAKMLIQAKRPRAALRRIDTLLQLPQLADDANLFRTDNEYWEPYKAIGWEARVLAVQCVLQCGTRVIATTRRPSRTLLKYLPIAIQRLKVCLQVAPSSYLESMLQAAYDMMSKLSS